ncbi:mechanosensitive ion channel family protein [Poseidonocella sp. HB161398]|uniref:mechanosensitive ion channel family protein n=1 Tax=Poseidonocella sp. HB161398 TaxID=2320855 RepID=UPI0011093AFA|nr:mechanosensitive ion channel domain-containing protein [Poseidonocella sp. HB161398]
MESYQRLVDVIALENLQMRAEYWVLTQVLVAATLWQLAALAVAGGLAWLLSRPLEARLRHRRAGLAARRQAEQAVLRAAAAAVRPLAAFCLVMAAVGGFGLAGLPVPMLVAAAKLLAFWTGLRLLSLFVRNAFWSRVAALAAFAIAALSVLGLLEATIVRLDRMGFGLGSIHLSVLDLLRGAVQLAVLLWVALAVARLLESRVNSATGLTPSLRVLTGKLLRFGLVTLALVAGLSSIGIDLSAFALFSGALGVGLGFGMQKALSNLISGLLLLSDRSIKPGDVLELSDPSNRDVQLFGWVTALNARYVSLTTRDGTEWLVPNEELISTRIVNWSYNHHRLRLLTPISVSFDCDVRLAMELAETAAKETPRVMTDPPPVCRLMSFGDSAVNLEMRFWIEDPVNGVINVRSQVLLAIWESFRAHGIRTPLGHRDLYIKEGSEVNVVMKPSPGARRA